MKINLRRLRLEKGYTVRDLERFSGVSHSHISMIENGERTPTIDIVCKLCRALNVTIDEMVDCSNRNAR